MVSVAMVLSIITLNYKNPAVTIVCLSSLYKQFEKEFHENSLELIIVDNGSNDGSFEKLNDEVKKKRYRNVHVFGLGENGGFGEGCNYGAKQAKGEFSLFLNNDTLVQDHSLWDMATYMKGNTETAIMGGALQNVDGSHQSSAARFYTPLHVLLLLLGLQRFGVGDPNPKKIAQVDWVKGALFMIRSDIFRKLGGFDEKIFMYTEDMELCYRAKLAGYKVYFYPDVSVMHTEHGSANRSFAIIHIYQGLLYFYKKHKSYLAYMLLRFLLLTKAFVAIFIGNITHNSYLAKTYREAMKF